MKWGILFRGCSWWIGAHWSSYNQRLCINLIPLVTIWIVREGGIVPRQGFDVWRSDRKALLPEEGTQ